jgi:hypothetical protein
MKIITTQIKAIFLTVESKSQLNITKTSRWMLRTKVYKMISQVHYLKSEEVIQYQSQLPVKLQVIRLDSPLSSTNAKTRPKKW